VSIDRGGPRHEKGLGVSIRHGVVAAVAVAVASSGALSGCSDADSEPSDSGLPAESELTETPTSPSPDDASPTDPAPSGPQEPRLPAAAKAPGKAGAKAFVAYYIRLLNYASHTGETASLGKFGSRCGGCMDYVRLYESTYKNGGWIKRGNWVPDPRTWFIAASGNGYFVAVHVDAAAGLQRPRRSSETTRFLADRYRLNFLLADKDRGWRMKSLGTPG